MIIVTANLPTKEEKVDEIIKEAEKLIVASRNHEGNISYNLYQDVLDKKLTFIEKWESKEALEKHMKTEEFIEFGKNSKDYLDDELNVEIYLSETVTE